MCLKPIKIYVLCLIALICLCGCGKKETFVEIYNSFAEENNIYNIALIYLDEDNVPELLSLENDEYRLFTLEKSEVIEVTFPSEQVVPKAYGKRHDFEEPEKLAYFWFEYVPYKGLIRLHGSDEQGRSDYYLKYTNGAFQTELVTNSAEHIWSTFDGEKKISNEEFLVQLSALGYEELVPCEYLYETVEEAYKNINTASDNQKVLEEFVSGEKEALYYVKENGGVLTDEFVMRGYEDFLEDITAGEDVWGSLEYIDFDNDGEDELIIHGYAGSCLFFDVIGDTVYFLLRTGGTSDNAYVAEFAERDVIVRADYLYVGRKYYRVLSYDACGCLIDSFKLSASYEGAIYTADDKFEYRNNIISIEEFERLINSIHMK